MIEQAHKDRIAEILRDTDNDTQTSLETFVSNVIFAAERSGDKDCTFVARKEDYCSEINDMLDDEETHYLSIDERDEIESEFADELLTRYQDLLQENFDRIIETRISYGEL